MPDEQKEKDAAEMKRILLLLVAVTIGTCLREHHICMYERPSNIMQLTVAVLFPLFVRFSCLTSWFVTVSLMAP